MRIVIDMQGVQTQSRFRGIGRYTMAFAQAVVKNRGEHEIMLALSGLFPDSIEPIRAAFDGLLQQEDIRVWHAPGPVLEARSGNDNRRETAEILREAFLASLQPDLIHITSLFEGYMDDAVTSIGCFDTDTPVSTILYDLIPLLNPNQYLKPKPRYETYYLRKIESLKRASSFLAISDFSRQEGNEALGLANGKAINISTAIDRKFQPTFVDANTTSQVKKKFGILRPFVFYTGGADERKNLPRLIEAYAALPDSLKSAHQLLFAGKKSEGDITRLKNLARAAGMHNDDLIIVGFVSDKELVQLYNLCQLFVFPSWHEGFGLPALEAMACGAPAIGASTSSLPEVIGLTEALFDPYEVTSISNKMAEALQHEDFRSLLREKGLAQAQKFSWDETAQRSILSWESLHRLSVGKTGYQAQTPFHNQLLYAISSTITKSQKANLNSLSYCLALNEGAGIERQLLVDISELCQRDAATGVQRVVRSYLNWLLQSPPSGFRVEPVYATREIGYRYARSYTSRFCDHDETQANDEPVRWQRGDIFFGLDMQHHVQLSHITFYRQLRHEGVVVKFLVYDLLPIQLAELFKDTNAKALHEQWLTMIVATDGAICISKATADAFDEWVEENDIMPVPSFRTSWVHIGADIDGSNPSKGMPDNSTSILRTIYQRPSFLCVSTIEPRKRQQQILDAMEQLWQGGADINLVFVGKQGWKVEALAERLRTHQQIGSRLFWLQGISDEYLEKVYAASTCLVVASLNEGFGLPLIEAARHGIPIVARDIPVFREVAGDHAYYFRGESAQDLAEALRIFLARYQGPQQPSSVGIPWSTWQQSTEKLKETLVVENYPRRQLLVDISELVQRDAKTGIQRVVRNILKEWLLDPPDGYRVEPVYATIELGYRYARKFTQHFLGIDDEGQTDEPIDYAPGDIFFGLDLNHHVPRVHRAFLDNLYRLGVDVRFMVYDLLPIRFPEYWEPKHSVDLVAAEWLTVVTSFGGAICISKSAADDLIDWLLKNAPPRLRPFKIDWFHLGADTDNTNPTKHMHQGAETTLGQLLSRLSFLMVGTLEPRKGHAQVLETFELLWHSGVDVNLVIVGKLGWMVEDLALRLRTHPESNKRLYWLEGISDEYLEDVYVTSTCLIASSYGEGFGLPLVEAAQHKLPIIARDIPVFREVAGKHAYYFDAADAHGLALIIKKWLDLYKDGAHPASTKMPLLTWRESAKQLEKLILNKGKQKY